MTKMLLFKPELGTLTRFDYPTGGSITELVENNHFQILEVLIDGVTYNFYVGDILKEDTKKHWSFYHRSSDQSIYGNIVIEAIGRDIIAEDILNIKSHIVVNPKGYMIYLD